METMINLQDLLKHEILDLYSAEEQIIEAMPAMIEKAKNPELKKALREHLKITEEQKKRLDRVKQTFGEGDGEAENGEKKGFFSRLFGGSGGEKCKGMEGLITEGEKIMSADITDEALDAAIIASAQKIEHYEICGYGTARAFARELKLAEVERLLSETLNEEYRSDDLLTALAVGKLNMEAEMANGMENGKSARSNRTGGNGSNGTSSGSGGRSSSTKKSSGGSSNSGSSKASKSSKGGGKSSGGSSKGSSSSVGGKSSSRSSKDGSSKGGGKSSSGTSKGSSSTGGSKSSGSSGGGSKSSGGSSKSGGSRGGSKSASASKSGSKSSSSSGKEGSKSSKGGSKKSGSGKR